MVYHTLINCKAQQIAESSGRAFARWPWRRRSFVPLWTLGPNGLSLVELRNTLNLCQLGNFQNQERERK